MSAPLPAIVPAARKATAAVSYDTSRQLLLFKVSSNTTVDTKIKAWTAFSFRTPVNVYLLDKMDVIALYRSYFCMASVTRGMQRTLSF